MAYTRKTKDDEKIEQHIKRIESQLQNQQQWSDQEKENTETHLKLLKLYQLFEHTAVHQTPPRVAHHSSSLI